jgi:hypothetical protein
MVAPDEPVSPAAYSSATRDCSEKSIGTRILRIGGMSGARQLACWAVIEPARAANRHASADCGPHHVAAPQLPPAEVAPTSLRSNLCSCPC